MKIKSRFTKIAVASGLIVATGASVLGMTSFASAQVAQRSNVVAVAQATDTTLPTDSAVGTTAVDPAAPQAATPNSSATPAAPSVTKADRPSPLATASKVLGITETELKTELQAGKSVADVATAKNVDLATVKAALLAEAKAHLAEEVTSGKHTQAEADAKLAEMTSRIDTMLTTAGLPARGPHGKGGHEGKGGPGKFMTATLATTLKLTQEELKTQLHSGKSLADVAKAQGVDIADVKTVLTSDVTAHLAEEVTSGKHTQTEADAKLAEFKTNLDTMVNRVGPAGGMKGEGRGHGPRGGNGPMGQGAPSAQNTSASV